MNLNTDEINSLIDIYKTEMACLGQAIENAGDKISDIGQLVKTFEETNRQLEAISLIMESQVKKQLDKRELMVAMCLQGVISSKDYGNPTSAAQFAILCADALIHELGREEE